MQPSESLVCVDPIGPVIELHLECQAGGQLLETNSNETFVVSVGWNLMCIARSNVPILRTLWSVDPPGRAVADYALNWSVGKVAPLTASYLTRNPIEIKFTVPGTWAVRVLVFVAGEVGEVVKYFKVNSPAVTGFRATTGAVTRQRVDKTDYLAFGGAPGSGGAPGIEIEALVNGQEAQAGTVGLLQVAVNQRFATDDKGRMYVSRQNGLPALDVGPRQPGGGGSYIFYQDERRPIAPGATTHLNVSDSPGQQLGGPFQFISIGDDEPVGPETYRIYILYQANQPGSIWVPLGFLNWYWQGSSSLEDGVWQPAEHVGNSINPAGAVSSDYPEFHTNTLSGEFIPAPPPPPAPRSTPASTATAVASPPR